MAQHTADTLVCGPSGGGKSTYMRERHAKFDGISIWLTTKKNERKAEHSPPNRIRRSSCSYPEDIEQARRWGVQRPEPVQICIDEVHNAPTFSDGEDGPVRTILHENREDGVEAVIATQNPQDLRTTRWNYGPLQNCAWIVWVGPARTWHSGFREWLSLEADQLPDTNYRYHVIRPSDPPEVAYRGRTSKQYS